MAMSCHSYVPVDTKMLTKQAKKQNGDKMGEIVKNKAAKRLEIATKIYAELIGRSLAGIKDENERCGFEFHSITAMMAADTLLDIAEQSKEYTSFDAWYCNEDL